MNSNEFILNRDAVLDVLKTVNDPELHRDLVNLGMIKEVKVLDGRIMITVELTTLACPLKAKIENDVKRAVYQLPGVQAVEVQLTAKVPTDRKLDEKIKINIKNIIVVSSGKGGVGKSTLAVNLAIALARSGARVGIMDADIYGPNIPTMMGINELPKPRNQKLIPASAYDVKIISIGLLVKGGQPLIWRGPLLHSTIKQFLTDVDWGELDYLIVDLPPGTGDVQLSLSQYIPITCGLIVTTPQQVSLDDASRAIEMFQKLNIPIAGIVENMAAMQTTDGQSISVFGEGGGEKLAIKYHVPLLGSIPLDPSIRINGDRGTPIVASFPQSPISEMMNEIACEVASFISRKYFNKIELN